LRVPEADPAVARVMSLGLAETGVSARVVNLLESEGIATVGDLVRRSGERQFEGTLREVKRALGELELRLDEA
jgi:DNA-directed RNA polymerase alpha subunit